MGLKRRDDGVRRVFVKHDDGVHARKRSENLSAFGLRRHRAAGALDGAYRPIGVEPNNERVAEGSGLLEIAHVARVQEVEDAVCEDHAPSLGPQSGAQFDGRSLIAHVNEHLYHGGHGHERRALSNHIL